MSIIPRSVNNMEFLKTKWTDLVSQQPLQEYPRPQFIRDSYLNLNGYWDYCINKQEQIPEAFKGKILVPFSPEAPLSGVGHILQPDEVLWYKRTFTLEESFVLDRVILHFGAVDQYCEVFVNGETVGRNLGGYYPFSFDITSYIHKENTLIVKVRDYTDTKSYETGKQHLTPGRIWYTPQSGIWQTVWLEAVHENYLESVKITPDPANGTVNFSFRKSGEILPVRTDISFKGKAICSVTSESDDVAVKLESIKTWSPEEPNLYDVTFTYDSDTVKSYFAMRSISTALAKDGHYRIFLNGKPYFCNGLLDQGYWSDGLYTAPCEQAIEYDILTAKKLGFNTLRKHIKIEPLRWYYLCDKHGMLVIQDMVNGGRDYSFWYIMLFQLFRGPIKDDEQHYKGFGRTDEEGRKEFHRSLKRTVNHLYNSPCIIMWTPFNEGWGQFDSAAACKIIQEIDSTRLIDHASGWHDQGAGDVDSHHRYILKVKVTKDRRGKYRPFILSEFGGYKCKILDHSYTMTPAKGHHTFADEKSLNKALYFLYQNTVLKNIPKGMAAAIYTQISDVEDEVNGIFTYDRKVMKLQEDTLKPVFDEIARYYENC